MARADYIAVIGETDYPPTEEMWEELEAEINQVKRDFGVPGMTDLDALRTDAAGGRIMDWMQRHKLESPSYTSSSTRPTVAAHRAPGGPPRGDMISRE